MGATGAFTANTVAVYVNLLLLKKGGGVELNKPVNQ
jgi:hypothetical protein